MRVLITGASGMVGQAVAEHCIMHRDEVFSYNHQTLDISNAALVSAIIDQKRPEALINCAAWTDVDGCEHDPERAFDVNASGPENLARAGRKVGAVLVTISTDYVFDGKKEGFYTQSDDPNPLSVYGHSKLDGERRAQVASARTVIVRTGFVFGNGGKNFLSTVVARARRGEPLKAIGDSWGTPTYAPHLAARLRELAQLALPGVFHVVNSGKGATFEEFAHAALEAVGGDPANLESVTMASLDRPAPRPKNSRLKCLMSEAIGLAPLPVWQNALAEYVSLQAETPVSK